jgi:hypothetical protein
MEIHTLKVLLTEDEANRLLAEHMKKEGEIENLRLRFAPEGVIVTGDTKALFFKVGFETLWTAAVVEQRIVVRLASLKVAGLPAGKFRGLLLNMARDAVANEAGVVVEEESIFVDLNEAFKGRRIPVTVRLTSIRCSAGVLTVEAG